MTDKDGASGPRRVWFAAGLALGDDVERDCDIVDRWRETVGPDDAVWIIGPALGRDDDLGAAHMEELPGRVMYLPGGHLDIVPRADAWLRLGPGLTGTLPTQRSAWDEEGKFVGAGKGRRLPRRWQVTDTHGDRVPWAGLMTVHVDAWDRTPVSLDTIRSIIEEHTA